MLCDYPITDYILIPINQVNKKLEQGYRLYGPVTFKPQPEPGGWFQVLVKLGDTVEKQLKQPSFKLKSIEAMCIELLILQYSSKEMAKKLHRSHRTIDKILTNLRDKFQCRRRFGIVLAANEYGFIKGNRVLEAFIEDD